MEKIALMSVVFLGGILGILARWIHLWQQKRTSDTFFEYLFKDFGSTVRSLLLNLMSSAFMLEALPEQVSTSLMLSTVYGAFMAGFGIDSRVNIFTKR